MKKYFYAMAAALVLAGTSKAAPGDTTWVQANISMLSWNGNYDTTIAFPSPGTTYRRIYMIFTLGKYSCPGYTYGTGSVPWCGDWDYTVQNMLMTPGGDTLELGRLITPYANNAAPRTPWAWTQHYVYDVTDYAPKLQGSASVRIVYSGYSGGFTGNIRFAFVEGTPDRNVLQINRLWHGYFTYGDTAHLDSFDINTHLPAMNFTAPAGTQAAGLKMTVTGHGSDNNNCNEFCAHNYYVYLNSAVIDTYNVWRPTCGMNELYPQSGTWLLERANWCPGALVYSQSYNLPGVAAGSATNVDVQFDPYVGNGGAGYQTEGTIFFYGGMNKTVDASLDDIISPTTDENHFRENPSGKPIVYVKNTGSAVIDSITFQYGIKDSSGMQTYIWHGSINPLQGAQIELPNLAQLDEIAANDSTTGSWDSGTFVAEIVAVNGVADNDQTNDTLTSRFYSAPRWPASIKVQMLTNNEATNSNPNVCETSWAIYDANNNVFAQRVNASLNTLYTDTVNFWASGFYRLEVYDSSCDGLEWWANENYGVTAGYLYVRKFPNANLSMHGYVYGTGYSGTGYNNDFGCGYTQYFYVNLPDDAVKTVNATPQSIEAYPNPAQNTVTIELNGLPQVNGQLQLYDILGRNVYTAPCRTAQQQINVSGFATGSYTVIYLDAATGNKLQTRLLILK